MSRHATMPHRATAMDDGADECARVGVNGDAEGQAIGPDPDSISVLIAFFRTLDDWDREANLQ